jgi:hypothetical protein
MAGTCAIRTLAGAVALAIPNIDPPLTVLDISNKFSEVRVKPFFREKIHYNDIQQWKE